MRVERLCLEAFGPFVQRQEIDFSRLEGRSPFLIQGPTGAGKTTILDAICFALYGASSGGEREARNLRCDFAPDHAATEVCLEWSLGQRRFRVLRRPERLRPKIRGAGFTRQPAEATLWRLDDGPAKVLASGWAPVGEACQQLLGFSQEQFRQVVILPQGQFRRLLMADSREREAVLATLFQTGFYQRLTEALKERARGAAEQIRQLLQAGQNILAQAEAENADALAARIDALAEDLRQSQDARERLRQAEQAARQALNQAQAQAAALDELAQAQSAAADLAAQAPAMDQLRQALARAQSAAALEDVAQNSGQAVDHAQKSADALALRQGLEAKAGQALQKANQALEAERAREAERQSARERLEGLAALEKTVAGLEQAAADLARLQQEAQAAQQAQTAAEDDLAARQTQAQQAAAALERARALAGQLEGLESLAQQAARQRQDALALAELAAQEPGQTRAADRAGQQARDAQDALSQAQRRHGQLLRLWRDGQAAALAAGLAPGAPCPVCGSTNHPAPAEGEPNAPDQKALEAAEQAVERARQALAELERQAERTARDLVELRRRQEELRLALGPLAEESPEELARRANEANESLAQAERAGQSLPALQAAQVAAQGALAQAQAALLAAQARAQDLARQTAAQRALHAERAQNTPEQLRPPGALAQASRQAREQLTRLESALERARTAHDLAARDLAAAQAARQAAEQVAAQAAQRAALAQAELARRLALAGFAKEAQMTAARMEEKTMAEGQRALQDFAAAQAAAAGRLARAQAAAASLSRPDLSALELAANQAAKALERAIDAGGQLAQRLRQARAWQDELGRLTSQVAALEQDHGVIGRVAEAAGGQNAMGVTLQRFVLATLLDEVLEAASRRLGRMSRGRYALRRAVDRQDRRKAAGLDLMVDDDHHGSQRPVSTLSGGESFLASLALALALAEVVQAHAGGVRLETIFIDEGFGSLDAEALDLAMAALIDLRDGGRAVGVISHVEEMKERIDARLEIIPGRRGSVARLSL